MCFLSSKLYFSTFFLNVVSQARPYWIAGSEVQMKEWTCYTEFGMPSGHSMMAIILMEFILRFFARVSRWVSRRIGFFYVLILILEFLVMFSRMFLGMHSLNQVLFGCMLGVYTFIPYYLFVERLILKWVIYIFRNPKSALTSIILLCCALVSLSIALLLSLLISYQNTNYINVINTTNGCQGYHIFKSFQYKCLQDTTIFMAAIAILLAFSFMHRPAYLVQKLQYSRLTFKYLGKFAVTLLIPLVIVGIFMNPLWQRLYLDNEDMALLIWGLQAIGLFLAPFALIYLIPIVNMKFGFELYIFPESYEDFKKHEVVNMIEAAKFVINRTTRRETQLTPKKVKNHPQGLEDDGHVLNESIKKQSQVPGSSERPIIDGEI